MSEQKAIDAAAQDIAFSGEVGLRFHYDHRRHTVVVAQLSPRTRRAIRLGDALSSVDGQSTIGLPFDAVMAQVR